MKQKQVGYTLQAVPRRDLRAQQLRLLHGRRIAELRARNAQKIALVAASIGAPPPLAHP